MSRKSRFVSTADEELVEIELGDGDIIKIKPRLSFGDRQAIRSAAIRTRLGGAEGGEIETTADLHRMNIELMIRGIAAWNLKDSDEGTVPITRATIAMLDEATGETILRRLVEQYPPVPEEQKN